MLFQELLKSVQTQAADDPNNAVVTGITYDSREIEPGFLFVAIEGYKNDGTEYIGQAVEKGAAAVVTQKAVSIPPGIAWALVADSRQALALMSASFYGSPSTSMRMVGVTGTNGKTTTTNLIASVLDEAGHKTGLIGTIHNRIGEKKLMVSHTTPESADLQELLHQMVKENVSDCVMEVSSHALALHRVDGCEFDIAVFTNLTQDHLDFHSNMQNYLETKQILFRKLAEPGAKTGKYAVINADDAYAEAIIEAAAGVNVFTYGIKTLADVRAEDIRIGARGGQFYCNGKMGTLPLEFKNSRVF